jgi:hypothetical protein
LSAVVGREMTNRPVVFAAFTVTESHQKKNEVPYLLDN